MSCFKTIKITLIVALLSVCSACFLWNKVEPPKTTALSTETSKILATNPKLSWKEAEDKVRCHFIYSEICKEIERVEGIKFYSHINKCGTVNDWQFTENNGKLHVIENVGFSQAEDVKPPKEYELIGGLRYRGTFLISAENYRIYDIGKKELIKSGEGSGLPDDSNTFSVWYKEDPITKEGSWSCDLCKRNEKFKSIGCEDAEKLVKFLGTKIND